MVRRLAIIGAFATLISSAAAAPAAAQSGLSIGIGFPVQQVVVGPYSGSVWQPAHYVWTAYGYQLVPGMWVPGPYGVSGVYYGPRYYGARYYGSRYYGSRYDRPHYYGPRYYAPRPVYYAPRLGFSGASFGFGAHFGNGHGHGHGYGHGNGNGHGHR